MKKLLAVVFGLWLLGSATEAQAKVCYKCAKFKPARYVCANRDTFKARRAARKICNWTSYTSTCNCWKWVKPGSKDFYHFALRALSRARR